MNGSRADGIARASSFSNADGYVRSPPNSGEVKAIAWRSTRATCRVSQKPSNILTVAILSYTLIEMQAISRTLFEPMTT